MADLRQILSQGRKRIGLLVGAGAPLSVRINSAGLLDPHGHSLIPGVEELTDRALAGLVGEQRSAVEQIRADLPGGGNIETILSKVRLLQTAIGSSKVSGLDGPGYSELGRQICHAIGRIASAQLPGERTPYHELVSWISGTQRPRAVEIFTTNYELLFESALERAKAPYFDGFSGGRKPFFDPVTVASDDLPSRWSRLWKLHGSIGWKIESSTVIRTGGSEYNELVYPDHLKYDLTQKQPYSALFERLKRFLLTPDTLLMIVGFSFRDAHINAVLHETLASNANGTAIAFQYSNIENEESACQLAFEHPNLSVYAADAAVISGIRGNWRPGDPPKNWAEIRASFRGRRNADSAADFLLGDFKSFARFCALSHSTDLQIPQEPLVPLATSLVEPEAPSHG